jgi:hypothetical protein
VKIVERLTKGESKKRERNKSHEASYILVEVGGTSTFVTHDVFLEAENWDFKHLRYVPTSNHRTSKISPITFFI